jgi:hypothetical protein
LKWPWLLLALVAAAGITLDAAQRNGSAGRVTVERFVALDYPSSARAHGVEGVVVVRATVGSDGRVVRAAALSGARDLVPSAVSNQRQWRYGRGARDSAVDIVAVYDFRLERGRCPPASRSLFVLREDRYASITACQN